MGALVERGRAAYSGKAVSALCSQRANGQTQTVESNNSNGVERGVPF